MTAMVQDIALSGGMQQGIGEPHIPAGEFLSILNGRQVRSGAIEKRPGWTKLGTFSSGAFVSSLIASGENVVGMGRPASSSASAYYAVKSYSPAAAALGNPIDAGTLLGGEASLTRRPIDTTQDNDPSDVIFGGTSGGTLLTMRPAMAYGSGVYAYVVVFFNKIEVTIEDAATGASIISRTIFSSFTSFSCDFAVPVIVGTKLIVVGREHATTNIKAAVMDLTNIAAGFGTLTTLRSDAKASPVVKFDAVANGSNFTIAYIDFNSGTGTNHIGVYTFDTTLTAVAGNSVTCSSTLESMSMCIGNGLIGTAGIDSTGKVYLAIWTTALAATLGPTIAITDTQPRSCACVVLNATHVVVTATMANGGSLNPYTTSIIVSTTGATSGSAPKCFWTYLLSKPWVENGLVYGWVAHQPQNLNAVGGFPVNALCTAVLVEFAGSGGIVSVPSALRPVGSDCNRFLGAFQLNQGGTYFPMSVVSPANDVFEVVMPFLESPKRGFFARETANFAATNRWQASTIGGLTSLSSGPLCYDGASLFETGFLQNHISLAVGTPSGAGSLTTSATYYYAYCYVYQDASGNLHRSAPSVATSNITQTSAGNQSITLTIPTTQLTWKQRSNSGVTNAQDAIVWIEIYRSTANPSVAAGGSVQLYLVATTLNSLTAATVSFPDATADSSITSNPTIYTFSGAVPNVAPPSFISSCSHKSRIFGIAPDQRTIWYSKQYTSGEAINFADTFTLQIDEPVKLTALASMDDKLVIFGDRRIYFLQGDGPADNGTINDYGLPIRIASDVGCADRRSIVQTPDGLMFASSIGFYLLDRGLNLTFIGNPVMDEYAAFPQVMGGALHPNYPWAYFLITTSDTGVGGGSGVRLVYDYLHKKWYKDTGSWVPMSIVRTPTKLYMLSVNGDLWVEDTTGTNFTDNGTWVPMQFEIAWAKLGGLQGYQNTRAAFILGKYLSDHDLRVDWRSSYSAIYDRTVFFYKDMINEQELAPSEQFRVEVAKEQQAVAVRVTDQAPTNGTVGTGQGARIYAISFEADELDGAFRVDSVQQAG